MGPFDHLPLLTANVSPTTAVPAIAGTVVLPGTGGVTAAVGAVVAVAEPLLLVAVTTDSIS